MMRVKNHHITAIVRVEIDLKMKLVMLRPLAEYFGDLFVLLKKKIDALKKQ